MTAAWNLQFSKSQTRLHKLRKCWFLIPPCGTSTPIGTTIMQLGSHYSLSLKKNMMVLAMSAFEIWSCWNLKRRIHRLWNCWFLIHYGAPGKTLRLAMFTVAFSVLQFFGMPCIDRRIDDNMFPPYMAAPRRRQRPCSAIHRKQQKKIGINRIGSNRKKIEKIGSNRRRIEDVSFGLFRDCFGIMLGLPWDYFGMCLNSFRLFWCCFGLFWSCFGICVGIVLGLFWVVLGCLVSVLGIDLGSFWDTLEIALVLLFFVLNVFWLAYVFLRRTSGDPCSRTCLPGSGGSKGTA